MNELAKEQLAKEQLTKEQFTKEESNKNEANVCTDTNSIEFHFYDGANIPSNAIVKIQEFAGNKFKITHTQKISTNLNNIRRLSGDTYVDTRTGEIRNYLNPSTKSTKAIRRTIREKLQPLLENNFDENSKAVMFTLTTSKCISDFKEVTPMFNKFWNRFKYKYKDLDLACVYIKELQAKRAGWHIHALVKDINNKYIPITPEQLRKIWGNGIVWITKINPYVKYLNHNFVYLEQPLYDPEEKYFTTKVETSGIGNLIEYMCKIKSKDGYIPTRGKIYGSKGKLKQPISYKEQYDKVLNTILKDKKKATAYSTEIVNSNTDAIINTIGYEIWK